MTTPAPPPPPPTEAAVTTTQAAAAAGRSRSMTVTFYGAGDNDPPGSTRIAHPNAHHSEAGGTGTFADPITLAADVRALAVGTLVYYPALRKYFVMEDDCTSCIRAGPDRPQIDLWAGDFSGSDFLACQRALTPSKPVTVEVDPPDGRPVTTKPLYGSGGCIA